MSSRAFAPDEHAAFAAEVRAGLTAPLQKTLPCRYLYDEVGSALFQAISALREYGLTRADDRIIRTQAAALIEAFPAPLYVVELGSGSGAKTRWILEALAAREPARYFPIDVSASALVGCVRDLAGLAEVTPLENSYLPGLREAVCRRPQGAHALVLFLGSTIGNFSRPKAERFLRDVRGCLLPGDGLLLGTDLEQSEARMLLAYDDPAGVTAAFNLNLLARVNRELGGDFVIRQFVHEARYNRAERRIEMHLRSRARQRIRVRQAGVDVEIAKDETIWTESSHKFRLPEIAHMAARAGFRRTRQWVDEEWPMAETLLTVLA